MYSQAACGNGATVVEGSFRVLPAGDRGGHDRSTWQGFSDALARAVEFVGTTLVFVLLGLWIDSRLGTKPLFTVVLGVLAIVGLALIAYYRYMDQVRRDEEGKPWTHSHR
jgi:F0F1-type ATP synthase assembly protein I